MNRLKVSSENSSNPKIGRKFQELSDKLLRSYFNVSFSLDKEIKIGQPPKPHRFDLVSQDGEIIVECKRYTWTKGGNPPSAKFATLNEAVFYQSFIKGKEKFIAIAKAPLPNSNETLADYYFRKFGHLLGKTILLEIDENKNKIRKIST